MVEVIKLYLAMQAGWFIGATIAGFAKRNVGHTERYWLKFSEDKPFSCLVFSLSFCIAFYAVLGDLAHFMDWVRLSGLITPSKKYLWSLAVVLSNVWYQWIMRKRFGTLDSKSTQH